LINFPDESLPHSFVEVSEKKIVIKPKKFDDVSRVTFVVTKVMFPNAEEILRQLNEQAEKANDLLNK